ncbi:MAG: hypothetical protein A3E80_05545 [Chlamydiae bacterium RIFCSPHIGHO2_12_FULL_49_9]|nr:MAG: hypothetical protein A3E80_05545 [Chlamydiae bacterium RIFCSPHIGHO2_12_FULL_49_9]
MRESYSLKENFSIEKVKKNSWGGSSVYFFEGISYPLEYFLAVKESMASVKKKRRAKIARHKRKKRRRRDRHKKK